MTTLLEVESKFDVDPDALSPDLSDLPAVVAVDPPIHEDLIATYFDTTTLDLLAAGITVRRRTGGHDEGWHVKVPADADRYEVHEPLSDSFQVPTHIAAVVAGVTRGQGLEVVAIVHTRRSVTRLRDQSGAVVAEFCDDVVDAGVGPNAPMSTHWREWELELPQPHASLAAAGADRLRSAGAMPSEAPTKLSRVLTRPPAPKPVESRLGPDSLTCDVLIAYLRAQASRLRRLDPLVRADFPDAVHQMRIVARRLRAVLCGYHREFAPGHTANLDSDLRWLARELGRARDLEVLRDRIRSTAGSEASALEQIDAHLAASHADAHGDAVAAMTSARYFGLIDAVAAMVESPPWSSRAQRPASTELRSCLRKQWRTLDKAARKARTRSGADRASRLHRTRRIGRRLRYCTEAAAPILGEQADDLARVLSTVQDTLGRHHDAILARDVIGAMRDAQMSPGAKLVRRRLAQEAHADDRTAMTLVRKIRRAPRFRWLR